MRVYPSKDVAGEEKREGEVHSLKQESGMGSKKK